MDVGSVCRLLDSETIVMMIQSKKKNLAIIGASYLQLPLIEKARAMGFQTHVFAWEAHDVGESAADHFYPISITDKEAILEQCKKIGICGICSIASDLAVITVNYVADRLNLTGNSLTCTTKSTNKYYMRKALQAGGDPIPHFTLLEKPDDIPHEGGLYPTDSQHAEIHYPADSPQVEIHYPAVIKPTDRSGSRGITIVNNEEEARAALEEALAVSFEGRALMEDYVDGAEYSLEGISWKGKHHILAITEKHTTGQPWFVETGHVQPAPLNEAIAQKVRATVLHALDTLEIQNGASHSEVRITADGHIFIMEIGARMGGDLIGSDLVPLTTGIDYVKAVIQIACGQEPDLRPIDHKGCSAEVRYILTKEDLAQMRLLQSTHPEQFIRLGYLDETMFDQIKDSSQRAGCYMIRR